MNKKLVNNFQLLSFGVFYWEGIINSEGLRTPEEVFRHLRTSKEGAPEACSNVMAALWGLWPHRGAPGRTLESQNQGRDGMGEGIPQSLSSSSSL